MAKKRKFLKNVVVKKYELLLSSTAEGEPEELRLELEAESKDSVLLKIPKLYLDKGYTVKEIKEL